jgi:FOG: FHA domain
VVVEQPSEPKLEQPQPAATTVSKYYLLFINTPNPAFNKTKLPLDFDIFPSISIGRSPENVIVIPDPEVSRKHAIISFENNELYLEDLNSTNGTYIYDGKVFQPVKGKVRVQPNSIIKLGNNTVVRIVGE